MITGEVAMVTFRADIANGRVYVATGREDIVTD